MLFHLKIKILINNNELNINNINANKYINYIFYLININIINYINIMISDVDICNNKSNTGYDIAII